MRSAPPAPPTRLRVAPPPGGVPVPAQPTPRGVALEQLPRLAPLRIGPGHAPPGRPLGPVLPSLLVAPPKELPSAYLRPALLRGSVPTSPGASTSAPDFQGLLGALASRAATLESQLREVREERRAYGQQEHQLFSELAAEELGHEALQQDHGTVALEEQEAEAELRRVCNEAGGDASSSSGSISSDILVEMRALAAGRDAADLRAELHRLLADLSPEEELAQFRCEAMVQRQLLQRLEADLKEAEGQAPRCASRGSVDRWELTSA